MLARAVSTVLWVSFHIAVRVFGEVQAAQGAAVEAVGLGVEALGLARSVLPGNAQRPGLDLALQMLFVSQPPREWPSRRRASIHADVARHLFVLVSCSSKPEDEFSQCLVLPEKNSKMWSDPGPGSWSLRSESKAVGEAQLQQTQQTRGQESPRHQRTHMLPGVR